MRELKFRVWQKATRQYRHFVLEKGVSVSIGADLEIEQYAGLKDKNGKEVYEGDIIREKWFDEDVRLGENRIGKVEYFTDGFVCWFVGGRLMQLGMLVVSHIEVIGNIHENQELLNRKEEE